MRIVYIGGGLANQLYQYMFYRYAQRCCPEETWYLDNSVYSANTCHNGYELEKILGIQAKMLSSCFDEDAWKKIIQLRKKRTGMTAMPEILSDMGVSLTVIAEMTEYDFSNFPYKEKILRIPDLQFHPEILRIPEENIYYIGNWCNKQWFAQYREENLAELAFPKLTDSQNLRYADMICSCLSVGIHVRRGDFVPNGAALPLGYYQHSCKRILDAYPNANFFVFSDDVDWCRANEEVLGFNLAPRTVYVTGNDHGKNYIDAQLMSLCRGFIMSNSGFCNLARLMNQNLKFWINPTTKIYEV